jgi:hypothetical protein
MFNYSQDEPANQTAVRVAYYRERAAQAGKQAESATSSELRDAYNALASVLWGLAEKNERRNA